MLLNILLYSPKNLDDLSFHHGPSVADDEYPVKEIKSNEVDNECTPSDTSTTPE